MIQPIKNSANVVPGLATNVRFAPYYLAVDASIGHDELRVLYIERDISLLDHTG